MYMAKTSLFLEVGGVDLERKIWGEILWLRKHHQRQKDWGLLTHMTAFSCMWTRMRAGPYSSLLKSKLSLPLFPFTVSRPLAIHPASIRSRPHFGKTDSVQSCANGWNVDWERKEIESERPIPLSFLQPRLLEKWLSPVFQMRKQKYRISVKKLVTSAYIRN